MNIGNELQLIVQKGIVNIRIIVSPSFSQKNQMSRIDRKKDTCMALQTTVEINDFFLNCHSILSLREFFTHRSKGELQPQKNVYNHC